MTTEEKARAYDEALDRMKHVVVVPENEKALRALKETIFPELAESEDERIRKALVQEFKEKVQKSFEWKDGIPNNAVLAWLEKQKEPTKEELYAEAGTTENEYIANTMKMVRAMHEKQKEQQLVSCDGIGAAILSALASGIDTDEILKVRGFTYEDVEKYLVSIEQKEQKPAEKNITNEEITAWSDELLEFANQKYAERGEINKSLSAVVIAELGKYNGENYWKSPWAIDSTGLQYPLYFANLGAAWQKKQKSSSIIAASEWLREHVCCYMNSEYNEFHKCVEYDGSIDKERLINDFEEAMQKEQKPINQCSTLEPTLVEARKWNEAYEKGYSLGYENGRNEQKSVQCIDFDNEFENQVSHLLASVLNGEYEYDNSFIKHAAQSLMGYAKNELKPEMFNKAAINGEPIPTENQSVDIPLPIWNEEDEKIRKHIVEILDRLPGCYWYGQKEKDDSLSYLERQKGRRPAMIQWTGKNLKEVIAFTGKSDKFEKWFKSWDEYEAYVRASGNILKLFCEGDDHYKVPVGAWIIKTPDGHNVPSCFEFAHKPEEIDENKIIKKHITEDVLSSEVNKRLKECGWYVTGEKPEEWSDDIIQKAIKEVGLTQHQIYWLKANVFPPKQEWSDEDEKMFNTILKTLQDEYHDLCNDKYGHEEIISDLKSSCRKKMSWLEALPKKFGLKK